jgi:hypothetical protein
MMVEVYAFWGGSHGKEEEKSGTKSPAMGTGNCAALFAGNLCRSAQAGRSQPLIHLTGNIYLAGLPQKLVATNAMGHTLSLLSQVDCLCL